MRRDHVLWVLFLILFMGSCSALLRPAAKLADPMTRRPFRVDEGMPFPVLIVRNDRSSVLLVGPPYSSPRLKAGESFLVPESREREIEKQLATSRREDAEGGWAIDVANIGRDRQEIELYWVNDGYAGGVYEATSTSVRPLYRKTTGPGFAFVFGAIALGINFAAWWLGALLVRWFRARNRG